MLGDKSKKEIRPIGSDEEAGGDVLSAAKLPSSSDSPQQEENLNEERRNRDSSALPSAVTSRTDGACKHIKRVGKTSAFFTTILLIAYAITTLLGFASLENEDDPIEDPYFTIMELLILVIMPPMVFAMLAFRDKYSCQDSVMYSHASVIFMTICTVITSCVHAIVVTVGKDYCQKYPGEVCTYLFSFQWPSVVYAADILAWDWFFALSMMFGSLAVPWRTGRKAEKSLRCLMFISGFLSFVGLVAVPLNNMQVRIIGIVGYAVIGIGVFVVMGIAL